MKIRIDRIYKPKTRYGQLIAFFDIIIEGIKVKGFKLMEFRGQNT